MEIGSSDFQHPISNIKFTNTSCDARTKTGYSTYGPPTWRLLTRHGFAECAVRENRIYEEWLVRDGISILRQLGIDPKQYFADLVKSGKFVQEWTLFDKVALMLQLAI